MSGGPLSQLFLRIAGNIITVPVAKRERISQVPQSVCALWRITSASAHKRSGRRAQIRRVSSGGHKFFRPAKQQSARLSKPSRASTMMETFARATIEQHC